MQQILRRVQSTRSYCRPTHRRPPTAPPKPLPVWQDELSRRAPLNRREGDDSGGFTWAFEKLAKVRAEVSAAYAKLRGDCMAACGAGSGCDVTTMRDLLNMATDRSLDPQVAPEVGRG